jgi:hypothetical protein
MPCHRKYFTVVGNAMRASIIIFFLLTIFSCKGQTQQTKDDAFNVSHGVSIDKVDSSSLKDVRFVHFDSSVGVVFPKEYARKKFGKTMGWEKYVFFTPDTTLIKEIDAEINRQYCNAMTRFNSAVWDRTIDNLKEDNDKKSLKRAKRQMETQKQRFEKFCPQRQHDLLYHDKQYIGYVTDSGDRIIYIQVLDFRQDPYKLKPAFGVAWIDGWHGWFETNTNRLHYHVDKKLLTVNEDL